MNNSNKPDSLGCIKSYKSKHKYNFELKRERAGYDKNTLKSKIFEKLHDVNLDLLLRNFWGGTCLK